MPTQPQTQLTLEEQRMLIRLARQTVEESVRTGRVPTVDPASLPPRLREPSGCFVTLEKQGQLRGCIGDIFPRAPLYESVLDNARNAALRDTRFDPVAPGELEQIEIEVSVLTVPMQLEFASPQDLLQKLVPGRDGVVLTIGFRRATFLPQVWEKPPQKELFLEELSRKAGADGDAWRGSDVRVQIYHVQAFQEHEVGK